MALRSMTFGVVFVALCGCASRGTMWSHPQFSGAEGERQFLISSGQCLQEAHNTINIPRRTVYPNQSYTVNGQAQTTYGASQPITTRYNAEVRQGNNLYQMSQSIQESGEIGAAEGARRRVYAGCMAAQGWVQE